MGCLGMRRGMRKGKGKEDEEGRDERERRRMMMMMGSILRWRRMRDFRIGDRVLEN